MKKSTLKNVSLDLRCNMEKSNELNLEKNKVFIQGTNILNEENSINKIQSMLKNYMELDNISFLFGTGSSIILGAKSIQTIPLEIEEKVKKESENLSKTKETIYDEFISILKTLKDIPQSESIDKIRNKNKEINYSLEKLLNFLIASDFIQGYSKDSISYKFIKPLISIIKKELFKLCDLEVQKINESVLDDDGKKHLRENRYHYHEYFTKKILQRSLNLKRANIFTTNYDLAFDNAFDRLGVNYINGFSGFHKRYFRPETFEYDIFFPGSTTQGKVQRIEKVLRYFKLHGSLTWINRDPSESCLYGIEEVPIDIVRQNGEYDNLMIYPSTLKKSYTLDYPYSELLRQFATSIARPQSVLITFGYSFCDEHINDLIYQALTIPSFTLIIIDFLGSDGSNEIKRLKELQDPRIIIMQGKQLGDFPFFVRNVMPDLIEFDTNIKIAETMNVLYPKTKKDSPDIKKEARTAIKAEIDEDISKESRYE